MGLDITAYSRLEPANATSCEDEPNLWQAWVNPAFPGREGTLIHKAGYRYAKSEGFPAGSYTGYGEWRKWLASVAGYTEDGIEAGKVTAGPFFELVWFSDCEGVLGTKVCAKLAADFEEFAGKAWEYANVRGVAGRWFYKKYQQWWDAFKLASDGGAVSFH